MRIVVHRFIPHGQVVSGADVIVRTTDRLISDAVVDHPFVSAIDFSSETSPNLCPGRAGNAYKSGSTNWSATAGRYGGGLWGGNASGAEGGMSGNNPYTSSSIAVAAMVRIPTNNGRAGLYAHGMAMTFVPVGSAYTTNATYNNVSLPGVPNLLPADGAWHHVAMSVNGDTGEYAAYVDGVGVWSGVSSSWVRPPTGASVFAGGSCIVEITGSANNEATGARIDNLVVSSRPFTPTAIARLAAGELPSLPTALDLYNAGWF